MMIRLGILSLGAVFAAAACAGSGESSSATTVPGEASIIPPSSTAPNTDNETGSTSTEFPSTTPTSLVVDDIEVADEVIEFVVVMDELLADTAYEGAVNNDPEVFVATGWLFCQQLDQGVTPAEVLVVYVETLTGGDIEDADDGTLALAGSILGAAVGHLCTEHTELIEESL